MSSCKGPLVGKYRGKVLSTEDLTMRGRLLCEVASLPGMLLNWATPAVPYAGMEQGFFALPEEGADVWIEFERGDPNLPIWSGGYWEEGLEPLMPELAPELPEAVNILRSKLCTLSMSDLPAIGGIDMSVIDPAVAVPVELSMDSDGFTVTVGVHKLSIHPLNGITLTSAESSWKLTPTGLTATTPVISETALESVTVTAPTTTIESTTTVTLPFTAEALATLQTAVVETTLEVTGISSLTSGAEVGEMLNVTGESSFEGDVNVVGEVTVLAPLTVAADIAALGAILAPTAETVAAVAEVAIVP